MSLIVKKYLGNEIKFEIMEGQVYAFANSMTDSTKLDNWKRSPKTKEYIKALESSVNLTELIKTENGNGTWIHEKLVLSLARYISVDFEIWCDNMIAELLREGEVKLPQLSEMEMIAKIANNSIKQDERISAIEYKFENILTIDSGKQRKLQKAITSSVLNS